MTRREFLRTAGGCTAGLVLAGCDKDLLDIFNKGEEELWGLNVHPYGGVLGEAQIEALRTLGIRRVRMTLGLHNDLAGPYLGRLPVEFVGLLNDFDDPLPDPGAFPTLVRRAVGRAPGVRTFEVLNEPVQIPAAAYVERYLKPAYDTIKGIDPGIVVAAAAPTGTANGRMYFYQMSDAGADRWCDFRAVHLYLDNPEVYLKGTDRPFMVTESGVQDPARHVDWWSRTMAHISGVLETKRLYFYSLADQPDTGWAIISSRSRPGQIGILSPLYQYLRTKYGT